MKPILFNTEMVRAILDGRKIVTRRVCKAVTVLAIEYEQPVTPPYFAGELLWVRETWNTLCGQYIYRADQKPGMKNPGKWRPSIHMPKEAARIFLRVTGVRVERLQEIDANGIRAEGLTSACAFLGDMEIAAQEFALLWNSTIKPADRDHYGWSANPWVWVIEFERCEEPKEE